MSEEYILSKSAQQTKAAGEKLAAKLKAGDLVALFGGMGMGKTTFIKGLAKGLGVTGEVSSPTFTLVNEYVGDISLYHFDMYKVNSYEDLYSTGFFDYMDGSAIIAVEWSENIEAFLPENSIKVIIDRGKKDSEREITIQMPDKN